MVNPMMTIYATSADMARQFGFTHRQVLSTIENLVMPEIMDQHVELFDFGASKIAQMSEIGFNAVALHLPMNAGGDDEFLLSWKMAFLSQQPLSISTPMPEKSADDALDNQLASARQGRTEIQEQRGLNVQYIKVGDAEQFVSQLKAVMTGIYDFMEISQEKPLKPAEYSLNDQGEENAKYCFEVANQYHRPTEFLQALLDLIHVNFEPCLMSTYCLNSNMGFLYEEINDQPFNLGYFSIVSEGTKEFSTIWREQVIPYAYQCGYSVEEATAMFVVVTVGQQQYGVEWAAAVMQSINAGYSVNEALVMLLANLTDETPTQANNVYVGFCVDEALVNKIRISVWLTKKDPDHSFIH